MTLTEAKELIQKDINDENVDWDSPLGRAYKLSFEALKQIQRSRRVLFTLRYPLLPGETKE